LFVLPEANIELAVVLKIHRYFLIHLESLRFITEHVPNEHSLITCSLQRYKCERESEMEREAGTVDLAIRQVPSIPEGIGIHEVGSQVVS